MVVTDLPVISEIWIWHEYARLPSICTMQAPQSPVPQPNLVPVSLRPSRITQSSGVAGGASVDAALPLTVKFVAIASSQRRPKNGAASLAIAVRRDGVASLA